ncbi:MAG: hypothetical protein GKR89_33795 [Candidatus Latescibacteria bacterium]|nr:hypothetical protein [Candidatus Latescibacterota bacterium]
MGPFGRLGSWALAGVFVFLLGVAQSQGQGWGGVGGYKGEPVVEVGLRGGYDYRDDRWTGGGQVRWAWSRWVRLMLVPSGDVFVGKGKDHWQANADIILSPGALYVGLGRGYTNRLAFNSDKGEWGTNVFFGFRMPFYRFPLKVRIEGRWTYIERQDPFQVVVSFSRGFGERRRGW